MTVQAPIDPGTRGRRPGGRAAAPTSGRPLRAVILGSRRGERHMDAAASRPLALVDVHDRPVLDWIAGSLREIGLGELTYIGGYQIQKVMERYGDFAYRYHPGWQVEGEVAALQLGLLDNADHLVIRSDTLIVAEAAERLLAGPGVLVAGSRLSGVGTEPIFAGALLIRAEQLPVLRAAAAGLVASDPMADLPTLMARMAGVTWADLDGLVAPIGDSAAILRTVFRGKARTLESLAALCRTAIVLDQVRFSVDDWRRRPSAILARVAATFGGRTVVVRSSTTAEDGATASGAGRFTSVLDVAASDTAALTAAIGQVIASYSAAGRSSPRSDEIMVQPQIADLAASGVLFTRDLATGAPYFVATVDRRSGRSDVVTSGAAGEVETHYAAWTAVTSGHVPVAGPTVEPEIGRFLDLGRELMKLTHVDALDVEFGLDRSGSLYLFQVRPLIGAPGAEARAVADDDLLTLLAGAREFVADRLGPRAGLPGRHSVLGNMPDWNPAEMIGAAPRPLALSLYQRLVGDRAWARARARVGYRDVEPEPLILSVAGRPYVDVRASLASFLPAGLDDRVATLWVDACIERLRAEPHLHDKVEFEVTPTCLAFDWERHADRMGAAGLSVDDVERFREGLRALTARMIEGGASAVERELAGIARLAALRQAVDTGAPETLPSLARGIRDHVERCQRHGVEPFAVLARYAFVALDLLRSLTQRGVLDDDEVSLVLRAVPTVAAETAQAITECAEGRLSREQFVNAFGHLRSNSYEITASNYAGSLERIVGTGLQASRPGLPGADRGRSVVSRPTLAEAGAIFDRHAPAIEALLREAGLPGDARGLFDFVRAAIAGRERAKFEFMKDLDLALETIATFGERLRLTRDDLSFVHLDELLVNATDSPSSTTATRLRRSAGQNRKRAAATAAVRLPDLIRSADDVLAFRQERWQPNFVTTLRAVAPPVDLDEALPAGGLDGAIVLIRAADPGYDWIFSHRIAGLVTQYGGVGSHMAVRAAEFGLPAAIGCGEAMFGQLRTARQIELDCARRLVRELPLGSA